jgi:stringent starvation protein B
MPDVSTKPYFIRAIYEWCSDCGFTPYLSVKVDENTRVPSEYVKNGEIVLNVSLNATRNLTINNELVQFSARFNGVSREVSVPVERVQGIFARENGQGAFFTVEVPAAGEMTDPPLPVQGDSEPPRPPTAGRAKLKLIK